MRLWNTIKPDQRQAIKEREYHLALNQIIMRFLNKKLMLSGIKGRFMEIFEPHFHNRSKLS